MSLPFHIVFIVSLAGHGIYAKPNSIQGSDHNVGTTKIRFRRAYRSYYYNYLDEMAMSVCASIKSTSGVVYAVRRTEGESATCRDICTAPELKKQAVKERQANELGCIESLHVYKRRPVLADNYEKDIGVHKLGLAIYRYQSCTIGGAGPNYCCCSETP